MKYIHYEFDAEPEDVIEVTLDRAANVQLLDETNYVAYAAGQPFSYHGGYATRSPVRLTPPSRGHWHVIIDLGGGPGQVRTIARLVSEATA
jgi:hypothetical protein